MMTLGAEVLEAVDTIRLHAHALLHEADALTNPHQRTVMRSIYGSTTIMKDNYRGHLAHLAEFDFLEEWELPELLFPLSYNEVESIGDYIPVIYGFAAKTKPLSAVQLEHMQAIEASYGVVEAAMDTWMYTEQKRLSGQNRKSS